MILTTHARETMRRRGITMDEALAVVHRPELTECHQGRERRVRGNLAAVVVPNEEGHPIVMTFLFRTQAQWTDAEVAAR